jgi:hypothetical protein
MVIEFSALSSVLNALSISQIIAKPQYSASLGSLLAVLHTDCSEIEQDKFYSNTIWAYLYNLCLFVANFVQLAGIINFER